MTTKEAMDNLNAALKNLGMTVREQLAAWRKPALKPPKR